MKKTTFKKSIVGLSGLVLLSMTANSVSAATEGTVNYKEGATTAWTSPEAGQKVNSYLAQNQKVSIASSKKVFGDKWYKLDNGTWVAAKYISTNGSVASSTASTSNITVSYADGAVTLWSGANSGVATGKYVFNGDSLAVKATKTVYNTTWYQVEGGWVSGEFVSTNGQAAKTTTTSNHTVAKVATTTQAATTAPKATTPAAKPATSTNNINSSSNNNVTSNNSNNNYSNNNNAGSANKSGAVARAMSQIGKPYAWGAAGPNAFDCSGLMAYAFGSGIGRTTYQQEYAGRMVSISSLQPGDMVFWGSRGSTYHVGLYIGNGQYVHAPKPGDHVRVASISSYFMPSFGVRV